MPKATLPHGISIAIPVFNNGKELEENIEAIQAQPFNLEHEIVLVNDGSTNQRTLDILRRVATAQSVSVVELGSNKGVQVARTAGLNVAQYRYFQTIDADDQLATDSDLLKKGTFADKAVSLLDDDPEMSFVHSFTAMFGDYSGPTISCYPVSEAQIMRKHHAATSIIYRSLDGKLTGYSPEIKKWQDWSFAVGLLNSRRLAGLGNRVGCVEDFYIKYRIHDSPKRISKQPISELEMIGLTMSLYPAIFQDYYPNVPAEEIPGLVLSYKPDRLTDLLHVANYSLQLALNMHKIRDFQLSSGGDALDVP